MTRKTVFLEWLRIAAGLLVFSFGVHLTIFANIGLAPWDCLGMGVARHTPLNYGLAMTAMSVCVLVIDLALKERIGFGTIIDALLTGNFVQMFNDLNPLPLNDVLWRGVVIMLAGFVFMALGMMVYMRGEQGCGPRDALLVGLGKRLPRAPIGLVEIMVLSVVLLGGWLLGGPVGAGTLLSVFGTGIVLQLVYSAFRFEPRSVNHKGLAEVSRVLVAGRDR